MEGTIEGYNLSVAVYQAAKKLKMKDPRYYIYASLRGSGLSVKDSWMVAFQGYGANWNKETLEREMNKLESLDSVQARINEIKNTSVKELTPEELARETSKEKILTDLVIARSKMKQGSKEWTEQTRLIAEYAKIKQDELQTEDTTVHTYIPERYPTSHKDCLLFLNGQCNGGRSVKSELNIKE